MAGWKADTVVVAKNGGDGQFEPHPDGQYVARCVDVVDLGECVSQFENHPPKLVRKLALVFVTGETRTFNGEDELIPLVKEFTASMGEKASLRRFAEAWRGKSYKEDELIDGVDFSRMLGAFGVVTVEHKVSRNGRTYANILTISPVMKGVAKPDTLGRDYVRPKFLDDKKAQYADDAEAFRDKIGAPTKAKGFDAPASDAPSDDLPF